MRYHNGTKPRIGHYIRIIRLNGDTDGDTMHSGVFTVTKLIPKKGMIEISGRDVHGPMNCNLPAYRAVYITKEEAMIRMLEQ